MALKLHKGLFTDLVEIFSGEPALLAFQLFQQERFEPVLSPVKFPIGQGVDGEGYARARTRYDLRR